MPFIQVMPIGRPTAFYTSGTTTTSYIVHNFGFDSSTLIVSNDGTVQIELSLDGVVLDGEIKKGESITFLNKKTAHLYEKSATAGQSYRIWAY